MDGLTHVVRQSLAFNLQVGREVKAAVEQRRSLPNLYALPLLALDAEQAQLETKLEEVMSQPTSPYDSHPAVKERIRLVQQLKTAGNVDDNPQTVWDLLLNVEALQNEMTAVVQANIQRQPPPPQQP